MPVDPINYDLNVTQPFQAALQGYQAGAAIRNDQLQAAQQQQAMRAQQAQTQAMQQLMSNPNAGAKEYSNALMLAPGMREQIESAWKIKNEQQQQNELGHTAQVFSALTGGANDIAEKLMRDRAQAQTNSGNVEDAKHNIFLADLIHENPDLARVMVGKTLTALPGGDKVIDGSVKLSTEQRAEDLHPDAVRKAAAEAESSAVAAKFAESNAAQDLVKKGWDIQKIQSDIDVAKQNVKIAAMNAQIAREGNQLKREELGLKLQEMKDQRDEKVRTRAADVESARSSMDNFLNTADRLLSVAIDKDGKPTDTLKAATGPVDSRMPTIQQDVSDLEQLNETLGAQAFLSQVPSMKGAGGALSDAEGAKLQASLQNLSLKQSPEQYVSNLKEAQRLILKARKNVSARYGVPDSVPDTPAASATPTEVDALIKKYAGGR